MRGNVINFVVRLNIYKGRIHRVDKIQYKNRCKISFIPKV